MKLQTLVEISESNIKISTSDRILVMGSCFATNIAEAFKALRLEVEANPYGVLYNPISILQNLRARKENRVYELKDLVCHNQMYHSMDHHGSFSDTDPQKVLAKINQQEGSEPTVIIITLGTAWIYKYKGQTVANCHKLPSGEFQRERLSYTECLESLKEIVGLYPKAKKILTLSPIRHIKDGLQENSRSKAILRAAIAEVVDGDTSCEYFPSYEIMMDQLRDYRFYQSDMLHPSQQAIEYIIEKFEEYHFNNHLKTYAQELKKIIAATNHRPLHPQTLQWQEFQENLAQRIKNFNQKYPEANISDLISKFA